MALYRWLIVVLTLSPLGAVAESLPWWLDAVDARQAWTVATGAGVTVAVIDSGVDLSHAALRGRLRSDGYNFGDCTPACAPDTDASPQDRLGHGTFVAGIIAAQPTDDSGCAGLAPDALILPIKINPGMFDDFTAAALARAIDHARLHGANVINLSTDMPKATDEEKRVVAGALERAMAAGILIVAASGNRAGPVTFPGNYPGVIAVAGTKEDGGLYRRSNIGPEIVVAAPAQGMESTVLGGGIAQLGAGTSFAAPLVAATLANMLQIAPRLASGDARRILAASASPLAGDGKSPGFGMLNAGKALQILLATD